MQVAETKSSSAAQNLVQTKRQPFFNKEGQDGFFSKSSESSTSFFNPVTIQPKLTIGQPNDKYEVEADAMADKVVQRLSNQKHANNSSSEGVQKGFGEGAQHGNLVQTKCAECEEELQKKEEPLLNSISSAQRKSIFESDAEPLEESFSPEDWPATIQRKCASCEQEEKMQTKPMGIPLIQKDENQPKQDPVPPIKIDWLAINKVYFDRGLGRTDSRDSGLIEGRWRRTYDLGLSLGLSSSLAEKTSNILTPLYVDAGLSHDNPTIWDNMDRQLSTSSIIFSPTVLTFDLSNLGGTIDSPLRSLFGGKARNPYPNNQSGTLQRKPEAHIQRKCAEGVPKEIVQNKADSSALSTASSSIESNLSTSKGSGFSIPPAEKGQMESSFGADFSNVRIHTGNNAVQMNKALNAQAFTHGNHIYFNQGKYDINSLGGKHLLAHELTHTVQQSGKIANKIQRVNTFFGPASTGAPSNWSAQVAAATTSTQKAALLQSALGSSVVVNDRTRQSASDTSPIGAHLMGYNSSTPTINYDENLNSKSSPVDHRSLAPNAGYTLHSGSNFYIILGPLAIRSDNFYSTIVLVNHEFDHVQQSLSGSTLAGNESELDAWTSTFLREFHRTYILGNIGGAGTNCYVQFINQFMPLQFYYQKPDVSTTQKDAAIARIGTYYSGSITVHPAHIKVFRFWVHSMLKNSPYKDLVTRLKTDLSLGIVGSDSLATTRQFPCTGITNATFSAPPSLNSPTFPPAAGSGP